VTPFPLRVWRWTQGGKTPPGPVWGECRSCRKPPAQGPLPCWLQRTSLLRWFNLSTVSFPSCACPYPSVLAVWPGETPSLSTFIPASRIDSQSRPRGICVTPSPGRVGIAPTPDTSAQVAKSFLLFTWGPILRAEGSVSGQRIAPPRGYWWAQRLLPPPTSTARPTPAPACEPTFPPRLSEAGIGPADAPAVHIRSAPPPPWGALGPRAPAAAMPS
jgi:hypothetical protein